MKVLLVVVLIFFLLNSLPAQGEEVAVVPPQSVSISLEGYIMSCSKPIISVYESEKWRDADRDLPPKGNYFLDNVFVGYGWCDVLVCNPIQQPISVKLIEYRKTGRREHPNNQDNSGVQLPVYESIPLRGEIKVEIPYYGDDTCSISKTYTTIFKRVGQISNASQNP